MFDQNSLFFKTSKSIAEEFLQTSVIVDDQAYFESNTRARKVQPVPIDNLVVPGRKRNQEEKKRVKTTRVPPVVDIGIEEEKGSYVLDAQKVINSFAEKQIVCSVIKPSSDNDWVRSVEKLASSTDIMILDWEISRDNGKKIKNLLGKILKASNQKPKQLRLMVIYTGDPKIAEIAREIKTEIQSKLNVSTQKIEEQDNGFALVYGSTRIVVFSKPGTDYLPEQYKDRRVEFEQLADRVTAEFTVMTAGLVSNVAINSLALIRNSTHKILGKFSIYLDAPYLTHRALLVNPEDAEEFLTELIAEELRAILDEESVGRGANLELIKEWLLSSNKENFVLALNPQISFSLQETLDILQTGLKDCAKIMSTKKERPHKLPFTAMFRPDAITHKDLDERFSLITTIRTRYEKKKPRLTFGTILQRVNDNSFWVCMQPRCDAVRVDSERAFPVLPLKVCDNDKKFRLILENNGEHIRLSLKDKPYDLDLINFASNPNDNGMIVANLYQGNYFFKTTKRVRYKWIGELRPEQAQRIANEFAANLSRVGLEESEWLRLWATKG